MTSSRKFARSGSGPRWWRKDGTDRVITNGEKRERALIQCDQAAEGIVYAVPRYNFAGIRPLTRPCTSLTVLRNSAAFC